MPKHQAAGLTPLVAAAARGRSLELEAVLRLGASCECCDSEGATPLMHAAHAGHARCAEALVTAGADVNAMDRKNHTALDRAEAAQLKTGPALVQLLKSNGAITGAKWLELNCIPPSPRGQRDATANGQVLLRGCVRASHTDDPTHANKLQRPPQHTHAPTLSPIATLGPATSKSPKAPSPATSAPPDMRRPSLDYIVAHTKLRSASIPNADVPTPRLSPLPTA